jgi:uncharacterized membrane protein YhaH (DUF805 family)
MDLLYIKGDFMNFQTSIKTCFNKYTDFTGRASRSEYWWFILFTVILQFVLQFIGGIISAITHSTSNNLSFVLAFILFAVFFLPILAAAVRRLHDTDRSGWWILLNFVPLVGGIILLVFLVLEGTKGPNRFGLAAAV